MFYLIAFPAESQIYRFGHCLFGCPEGLSGNQTLVRSAYTLLYDENRKSAVWVAYEVTAASLGIASSLSRDLIKDDWVSEALTAGDLAGLAEQDYVPYDMCFWSVLRELPTGVKSTSPAMRRCAALA